MYDYSSFVGKKTCRWKWTVFIKGLLRVECCICVRDLLGWCSLACLMRHWVSHSWVRDEGFTHVVIPVYEWIWMSTIWVNLVLVNIVLVNIIWVNDSHVMSDSLVWYSLISYASRSESLVASWGGIHSRDSFLCMSEYDMREYSMSAYYMSEYNIEEWFPHATHSCI